MATIDDGATCVFVEGQSVPLIVQKSDGGFGYASTDMAALHHRLNEEKADWIIYVTGERERTGGRRGVGRTTVRQTFRVFGRVATHELSGFGFKVSRSYNAGRVRGRL